MNMDHLRKRVLIVTLLFILVYPLHAPPQAIQNMSSELEEILDQSQKNCSYERSLHSNIMLAQSFTPTKTPLTTVDIKLNKPRKTTQGIYVGIRQNLNDSDLTYETISAEDIPFFDYWIKVDLPDIDVEVNQTYYIVVMSSTPSEQPYRWMFDYGEEQDPYPTGKFYSSADNGQTWETIETEYDYVDAAFRTYTYKSHVDLVCNGFLNWTANITGNQSDKINLTGSFTVQNNGTPYSRLDWKIVTWPGWGTWQFSQSKEDDLRPEDGPTQINVFVEGPHSNIPDTYEGKILIRNEGDHNDSCVINARLVTAKSNKEKDDDHDNFFQRMLDMMDRLHAYVQHNPILMPDHQINPLTSLVFYSSFNFLSLQKNIS